VIAGRKLYLGCAAAAAAMAPSSGRFCAALLPCRPAARARDAAILSAGWQPSHLVSRVVAEQLGGDADGQGDGQGGRHAGQSPHAGHY